MLALQVHGGYRYSNEYLPEAWMRDQKLNSLHEGTTGIQGLDLLGRRVVAKGGAALAAFSEEVSRDLDAATEVDVEGVRVSLARVGARTMTLGGRGMQGDLSGMLGHSADYLELFSILVIAWMHVKLANASREDDLGRGLRQSARYWLATEVPRIEHLAKLCEDAERSYLDMQDAWF